MSAVDKLRAYLKGAAFEVKPTEAEIERILYCLDPSKFNNEEDRRAALRNEMNGFQKRRSPRRAARHGVVYTPREIADFIVNSVDHLSRKEFGVGLDDESVEVIDPFAGTGVFFESLFDLTGTLGNARGTEIDEFTQLVANANLEATTGIEGEWIELGDAFLEFEEKETE